MDSSHSGQSGLRSTLAPTIVKFADENKNKFDDLGIFEIGRVWDAMDENGLAVEKKKLAVVLASEKATQEPVAPAPIIFIFLLNSPGFNIFTCLEKSFCIIISS